MRGPESSSSGVLIANSGTKNRDFYGSGSNKRIRLRLVRAETLILEPYLFKNSVAQYFVSVPKK
jgi:hypothetical protein